MDILAPLAGTFIYISYPWNSQTFIVTHNLILQVFSTWMCGSLSYAVYNKGFHIESEYYMSDPWIKFLVFCFYLSKYYEYLDTFILYGKGKQPIFLQKYHHIGAAFTWHLAWAYNVDGAVVASLLNSGVHSIMYSYYLCTALKINMNMIKQYITYLQMVQFIIGMYTTYRYYLIETFQNKVITVICGLYTLGNFILFAKFIKDTYMKKIE